MDNFIPVVKAPRSNVVAAAIILGAVVIGVLGSIVIRNPAPAIVMILIGLAAMQSPRIAQQWERGVVLRLDRKSVV